MFFTCNITSINNDSFFDVLSFTINISIKTRKAYSIVAFVRIDTPNFFAIYIFVFKSSNCIICSIFYHFVSYLRINKIIKTIKITTFKCLRNPYRITLKYKILAVFKMKAKVNIGNRPYYFSILFNLTSCPSIFFIDFETHNKSFELCTTVIKFRSIFFLICSIFESC